ncbi:MAG: hypothetical protein JWN13_3942 [Betaproteobacteria bacterium]|jgi:hypothetical protein|nr:hypothetical protein [Betaproteobacteria bacterium]MEA3157230.1 hypothetical protein [Betaproteobacteria bacterium]
MNSRDQYVETLKTQLDQWNSEVAKWEEKTKTAQADVQARYEKQLEEFRRQRDQALEQMRQVQGASADAWQNFMRSTDEAWAKTREAYEKAYTQFRK